MHTHNRKLKLPCVRKTVLFPLKFVLDVCIVCWSPTTRDLLSILTCFQDACQSRLNLLCNFYFFSPLECLLQLSKWDKNLGFLIHWKEGTLSVFILLPQYISVLVLIFCTSLPLWKFCVFSFQFRKVMHASGSMPLEFSVPSIGFVTFCHYKEIN